jgi:hypothetical protein
MNKKIQKLIKLEERARRIANMRDRNELAWTKAKEAAQKSPEWKSYCQSQGIYPHYNYGDVTC